MTTRSRIDRVVKEAWNRLLRARGERPDKASVTTFRRWSRMLSKVGIVELFMGAGDDDLPVLQSCIGAMNSERRHVAIEAPWAGARQASAWLLVPSDLQSI